MTPEEQKEAQTAKVRQQIKSLAETTDCSALTELNNHGAKRLRIKYNACVKAGFSETQAVILCCQEWK